MAPINELTGGHRSIGRGRSRTGYGSGRVYPNFADLQLDSWADAYYGGNFARLVAAKHAYDPDRLFRFPHAL